MASLTVTLRRKRNMSCLWDSRNESDNTLEKMAAAEARPVCAGHVNTAETVQSFGCKWCDGTLNMRAKLGKWSAR